MSTTSTLSQIFRQPPREMSLGGFALAYAACYLLGYALSFEAWEFATTWPASGLYLAVLATSSPRRWPGYLAASLVGNLAATFLLFFDFNLLRGLAFWLGDSLEALLAAEFLRRIVGTPFRLRDHRAVLALAIAALSATTISATVVTAAVVLADPTLLFFEVWPLWWIADLVGCVVMTPLVCAWLDPAMRVPADRSHAVWEAAAAALGLVVVSQLVFGGPDVYFLDFGFFAYPFILWIAIRFGLRGATAAIAVFALIVITNTIDGRGPFARADATLSDQAVIMQAYICVVGVATQVLAAVVAANARYEAARRSETRFRELADTAPVLVWLDDALGRRQFVNAHWRKFTGQSVEEAKSEDPAARFHPDDVANWTTAYEEARRTLSPFRGEFRLKTAADDYRWCLASAVPRFDDAGACNGYVGTLVDITDLKYAEIALREAKEAADSANEAKSTFLAQVSHEIRTPLANILGRVELLRDASLAPEAAELAQGIEASAKALRAIVDDLLDLMRIETGNLRLESAPFSLRSTIAAAVDPHLEKALEKGLDLRVEIDESLPDDLQGDAGRLRQIVENLVNNAVKFTSRGEIVVKARRRGDHETEPSARAGRLELSVSDTGIGIAPDRQKAIFDAFTQADLGIASRYGGSGLGLSIVGRLVGLLGGQIDVSSTPGAGSVFRCELPYRIATSGDGAPGAEEAPVAAPVDGPKSILLVEDNTFTQRLVSLVLENAGHRVDVVDSVAGAADAARRGRYDVALLDLQLVDGSGFDAARRIRAAEATEGLPRLPLIALSVQDSAAIDRKCQSAGIDSWLDKLAGRRRLLAEIARLTGQPRIVTPSDLAAGDLLERLGGDRAALGRLADRFSESNASLLAELRDALARRDWTAMDRGVHQLRGAAGFLQAKGLLTRLDALRAAVEAQDPAAAETSLAAAATALEAAAALLHQTAAADLVEKP